MTHHKLPPIYPGEILKEEFLDPMGITPYRLAKDIGVPQIHISQILHGKRSITPITAIRLGLYFGNSPQFWMNLQTDYELEILEDKAEQEGKKASIKVTRPDGNVVTFGGNMPRGEETEPMASGVG
ncbi:MAG: HigA family addiction module antidote protein [Chloroflexi bacterium]|nr:HigA family addiction module antidote protein [Chloroflexota bacterium]